MCDDLSYGLNTLGPLCLWQCFIVYRNVPLIIQINPVLRKFWGERLRKGDKIVF